MWFGCIYSEQQIIDCSTRSGNLGCRGGSLRNTLRYVHTYGLMKADDYPYVAEVNFSTLMFNKQDCYLLMSRELIKKKINILLTI